MSRAPSLLPPRESDSELSERRHSCFSSKAEATRATGEAGFEYQPATGYRFVEVLELRSRGAGSGGSGGSSVGHRRAERIEQWHRIAR
jgi:hypothetical protein